MSVISFAASRQFDRLIHEIVNETGFSTESVIAAMDTALSNYKLLKRKHELTYFQLVEIWERDCFPMLQDWHLAA